MYSHPSIRDLASAPHELGLPRCRSDLPRKSDIRKPYHFNELMGLLRNMCLNERGVTVAPQAE